MTPPLCPVCLTETRNFSDCVISARSSTGINIAPQNSVMLIRCLFHNIAENNQGGGARCQYKVTALYLQILRIVVVLLVMVLRFNGGLILQQMSQA
jgi:hypothetical protein